MPFTIPLIAPTLLLGVLIGFATAHLYRFLASVKRSLEYRFVTAWAYLDHVRDTYGIDAKAAVAHTTTDMLTDEIYEQLQWLGERLYWFHRNVTVYPQVQGLPKAMDSLHRNANRSLDPAGVAKALRIPREVVDRAGTAAILAALSLKHDLLPTRAPSTITTLLTAAATMSLTLDSWLQRLRERHYDASIAHE